MQERYFAYGEKETDYLKKKDRQLGEVIDAVGPICCQVDEDLFPSIVHQIVGQQISVKALDTIWARMQNALGSMDAAAILAADPAYLQSFGISFRKVDYIRGIAQKVEDGSFDLEAVREMPDTEAIRALTSLRGVGVWTAEMVLLFGLQRPDIFSYDDLLIRKGLCILHHHRKINRDLFEKYRRRYHPCGSVASLYVWAVADGAVPG